MADTFSLRFEIDASRAEAGAKKFVSAINSINKSLDNLDAKADAAFSKLMSGGASGGDFSKLAKDLGKLNNVNINPAAVKSINSIGNAFKNLKAPSPAALKNISAFASTIPALLNSFNVSGNFAESVNKISAALAGFRVPSESKIGALKAFGVSLQEVAPSLRIAGNFAGIMKLGEALGAFRSPSEKAVSNMKAFFSALNNSGAKASINGSLVTGIINLSGAIGGMRAPSATSVKNLRDLFSALATFKPVSGTSSITAITQAFSGFKGPTPSQIKNVRDFVNMLGNLKVPTNAPQIAAYIEKIGLAAGTANKFLNNFRSNLGSISGGKITREASGMSSSLRGLENAFSGTFQAASVFRTLIGSITLGTLSKSIYDVNSSFNAFKSTLLAVNEGNLQATGEEMRYTEDMAKRLGQRIDDIQESFGSFSVSSKLAGVSTQQTREIFEATITAMTVLHRSSDRTKLALLALEQMMSKGTVSSEELRRQLGEQLPGSVNLAARALGVTTAELQKMLKAGSIASSTFLPKFAAEIQKTYGSSLESALKNATAQFNLLYDAVYDLQVVIGQSGTMDALAQAFAKVKDAISAPEFLSFASQFGERTSKVVGLLGDALVYLIKNIDLVVDGFKLLLALKIGGFIQGFLGSFMSLQGVLSAGASAIRVFGAALSGVVPLATAARTALAGVSLGATALTLLSGPIGAVILGLGALGVAWLTTRDSGAKFTTVVDMSTESLDRYKDSVATYTGAQIIAEQQKIKMSMLESQKAANDAGASIQQLIAGQGRSGGGSEFAGLVKQFREVQATIKATGGNMDEFAMQLANTHWNSSQAQALADAIINYNAAVAIAGKESEYAKAKLDILQNAFGTMNSANAVGQINAVAVAASGMAEAVSSAAARANAAIADLNRSKAAAKFSQDFDKAEASYRETVKTINSSADDPATKIQSLAQASEAYKKSLDGINVSVKAVENATKQHDATEDFTKRIEKYAEGATAASRKVSQLKEDIAALQKVQNKSPDQSAALTAMQEDLIKTQKDIANGGKPKADHTGGAASSYLDDATKNTVKYNKAQESLEKMLKKGQITQEQYNDSLAKLKEQYGGAGAGTDAFTSDFEKLKSELMPSTTALDEFTKKKQILDQEFANTGNLKEYTELLARLKKQYSEAASAGGSPWIAGINKGLTDLTKTSEDFTNDVAGAVTNAFNGLEDALTEWVTTGKMDFKSLATSILGDIARIVIRYTVIQPIIQALSSMFGGMGLGGGSSLGGFNLGSGMTPISTPMTYANGGAFNSGKIIPFANGGLTNASNNGILNTPTLFGMSGNRTGLAGEAGPEAIMPLKRGSDGSLGVVASGAVQAASNVLVQPKVNISIINNGTNASATSSAQQNPDGSLDVKVLLEQIKEGVASDISKGGTNLNKAVENRYGLSSAKGNKR